jgi:hypothetical protein
LEQYPNKIDWYNLSSNLNAIHLLEQNLDKVDWELLSKNPNAIPILERNINNIDWDFISTNPNAIHLLEQNHDKINWLNLSSNPSIFEYDYETMRGRMRPLAEELMADRFHPRNFDKWIGWGFDECQECEF